MTRGEIWRARLPSGTGRAQSGIRPVVVAQDDRFRTPTVLVVPFTSQQAATRFPGTLSVQPDGTNGLSVLSVALVFQLQALDRQDCLQLLGVIDPRTLDQILALLDKLTGR